jgi:hypothetical protein
MNFRKKELYCSAACLDIVWHPGLLFKIKKKKKKEKENLPHTFYRT